MYQSIKPTGTRVNSSSGTWNKLNEMFTEANGTINSASTIAPQRL